MATSGDTLSEEDWRLLEPWRRSPGWFRTALPRVCIKISVTRLQKASSFLPSCQLLLRVYRHQRRRRPNLMIRKNGNGRICFFSSLGQSRLGLEQLFRRLEKIEELEFKKKRLQMEPTNLNSMSSPLPGPTGEGDLGSLEFRRVVCEGVYDESKSVFIGPRSRSISGLMENGYYVLTPLLLSKEPGSVQLYVLVNRGWVPRSWRNKFLENSAEIMQSSSTTVDDAENKHEPWWKFWAKGPTVSKDLKHHNIEQVKVPGIVRGSEKPSIYVPANEPSTGQWFYVDVPAIVHHLGLPESTIYVQDINEDVNPSKPYPIPKDVNSLISHSVMPRDHLNYAFTWYSLSAAVTFMAIKRTLPKKNQR